MKCAECPYKANCKKAFGKFWMEKSNGCKGCKHPFKGWSRRTPPVPVRQRNLNQGRMI